jgi:peptidoglycan/xylan/chitin deacetylase (PgdA/CDA1 family)
MTTLALRRRARDVLVRTLNPVPLAWWRKAFPKDLIALCYHVVSDEDLAHIRLYRYKNRVEFETDIAYVRDSAVGYADVAKHRLEHSSLPANSVLLTFDDGLVECYDVIRPILLRHRVPAVFFLTTGFIDERDTFYETKLSLCLTEIERMPNDQAAEIAERLQADDRLAGRERGSAGGRAVARLRGARISTVLHPNKRTLLLWVLGLRNDDVVGIDQACKLLKVNVAAYLASRRLFVSSSQVKQMSAEGFTIGAHGINHQLLVGRSPESIAREIVNSTRAIRDLTGQDHVPFAFPYGGVSINRAILASILAQHPFIQLFFDSGGLHRDASFLVNRLFADAPSDSPGSNLSELFKAAWSSPSAWYRMSPYR